MPPRRAHTKSRNGCLQCKQRRVKCNEIAPRCAQCITRGLLCSFSNDSDPNAAKNLSAIPEAKAAKSRKASPGLDYAGPKAAVGPITIIHVEASTGTSTFGGSPSAERKLELELMHMYSTSTYKACMHNAENAEAKELWQSFVPRESMKYDFLLQAVLALASLHIATIMDNPSEAEDESDQSPGMKSQQDSVGSSTDGVSSLASQQESGTFSGSSSFYYHKALEYQTLAFASFLPVLNQLGPENCHAALAFSIIMIYLAIAFPRHSATAEPNDVGPRPGPMQAIFTLMEFLKGIHSLSSISQEWLNAGPFGKFILGYDQLWKADTRLTDPDTAAALQHLNLLNEGLNDFNHGGGVDEETHSRFTIIQMAISFLEKCFAQVLLGDVDPSMRRIHSAEEMWGERGAVLAWLQLAGPNFVALLRQDDPLSLLVFLHWGVLLTYLNTFWWSRDSGKLLVKEIAGMLHARGREWERRTRWGRKKVGLLEQ